MQIINDEVLFDEIIAEESMVLGYFSHERCSVCRVLKPKVEALLKEKFPNIKQLYCDVENSPKIAASHTVFTVPTILVWIEGKETYRLSRNIGLGELQQKLERPYNLIFD